MTRPAPAPQTKPRGKRSTKADDEAAASNPNILCHQIGLCSNLAELQAFISKHNLLNVADDGRFDDRMRVVIEEALDTMSEVLQNPGVETEKLFPVPADLAAKGWKVEREGVGFLFRKGQLATSQYVIRTEAADAARKLQQRDGKHKGEERAEVVEPTVTEIDAPAPASPFELSPGVETIDTVGRLARVKEFGAEELRQVIDLPGVQVTVRVAAERRLKKLEALEPSAAPATNGETVEATPAAETTPVEPSLKDKLVERHNGSADDPDLTPDEEQELGPRQPRRFKQELPVEITPARRVELLEEMRQLNKERVREQDRLDGAKATFKSADKRMELRQRVIDHTLDRGSEQVEVECEERFDYDAKVAVKVRLDTGAELERRPMTTKELQPTLMRL